MAKIETAVTVFIVDDDCAVRDGFARLLRAAGLNPRPYESAATFLADIEDVDRACILLDITMPAMTGPQVQEELNARGITIPVITISARGDEHTRASVHNLGARMFLHKPVDDQALLDAISWVVNAEDKAR